MQRYIGIDVHSKSCTVAVVDGAGKHVGQHVVETNGAALVECLKMIPGERHVCLEEGTQSAWLYEILTPHAQALAVVNVTESRGPKSDERDAFGLAEKLRQGKLERRVFKDLGPYRKLRELGRVHAMVVRDVVRVQNRIKSFMRSRGVEVAGKTVYSSEGREAYVKKLPAGPGGGSRGFWAGPRAGGLGVVSTGGSTNLNGIRPRPDREGPSKTGSDGASPQGTANRACRWMVSAAESPSL